jgi:hypothetical protein
MSFAPSILTSLHGKLLGLTRRGELVLGQRDGIVPALVYANTAPSSAVSNTTTETAFDVKYSLPANIVRAGSVLRIKFQGIASATNGTDTLQIKLYIGGTSGTALLVGTATDVADNAIFAGWADVVFRTVGSSGTFVSVGAHTDVPAASGTATMGITEIKGSTAIDTTAARDIVVSATWSAASASDSCRLDILTVELV